MVTPGTREFIYDTKQLSAQEKFTWTLALLQVGASRVATHANWPLELTLPRENVRQLTVSPPRPSVNLIPPPKFCRLDPKTKLEDRHWQET